MEDTFGVVWDIDDDAKGFTYGFIEDKTAAVEAGEENYYPTDEDKEARDEEFFAEM